MSFNICTIVGQSGKRENGQNSVDYWNELVLLSLKQNRLGSNQFEMNTPYH